MKAAVLALTVMLGGVGAGPQMAVAQMMGGAMDAQGDAPRVQHEADAPVVPDAKQEKTAKTFAAKAPGVRAKSVAVPVKMGPLTQRERVVQVLDRFTYGPKPGQVDRVMAQGLDKWLDSQFAPDLIPDDALNKRLADYPTLGMTAAEAVMAFPNRQQLGAVMDGKVPYPADPMLKCVYEVGVYKLQQEKDQKRADGTVVERVEPTEAEKAAKRKADQATATRVAAILYGLPKGQRMAALEQMPVEDRIAFSGDGNLSGDLKTQLYADFTPREREALTAMRAGGNSAYNIEAEMEQARILRDVMTQRQLQAVMANFWFNHFNVYAPKDSDEWYTTSYERDVIRKNALGNFKDLLLATAESPAMMVYLDNYLSIGPDSMANGVDPRNPKAKKGDRGLNENYGREVMELHTVGVNGGYTQADVTALAAILTGWGVDKTQYGGEFKFDFHKHEPGTKVWFGYSIDDNGKATKLAPGMAVKGATFGPGSAISRSTFGPGSPGWSNVVATEDGMKQGVAALDILADSPQTARFISTKLAEYFVADKPPVALVDRLQKAFLASHGDIKTVLRALIDSPEFNSRQYYRNKVKTPEEFVASAFRATGTEPQNPGALLGTLRSMGMPLYKALPPTGYYLTADKWMNSTALVDRLNFAYSLTTGRYPGQKFDAPKLLATGLFTPMSVSEPAVTAVKPVVGPGGAKLMGVAAPVGTATSAPVMAEAAGGAQMAVKVLEATMIGAPVSAQTNQLIHAQLVQQPEGTSPLDTLNLVTALVLGSPEFQVR